MRSISIDRLAMVAVTILALSLNSAFGQNPNHKALNTPITDQRIHLSDDHTHGWDDLRMLLITVTEISGKEIRWKHQTPFETKTGFWTAGKNLCKSDKGLKSDRIKPGKEFIGVYCAQCATVVWLYDSSSN